MFLPGTRGPARGALDFTHPAHTIAAPPPLDERCSVGGVGVFTARHERRGRVAGAARQAASRSQHSHWHHLANTTDRSPAGGRSQRRGGGEAAAVRRRRQLDRRRRHRRRPRGRRPRPRPRDERPPAARRRHHDDRGLAASLPQRRRRCRPGRGRVEPRTGRFHAVLVVASSQPPMLIDVAAQTSAAQPPALRSPSCTFINICMN